MPSTDSRVPSEPLLERTRALVVAAARWAAVGGVVGVAVSLALLTIWSPRAATDTAFALGALVLGFGVTAWSTAVGLGRTIEGMKDRLEVSSGWTEAGAREAFFVLSWVGAGWVVAAAASSILLGV
ncbi:DUF7268 family protein [Natrinema ejinorense]|uniref:Uncharacterized protein n=1 Tax=Natrinema ejinorense TaxID=373386 RepID=A0A2A5QXL8_9EURY|nr:hypothetical protein [Natrinema ejinorense]PCR91499.1 hypothetical protein CP557_13770 [Natrinema ejinorense]